MTCHFGASWNLAGYHSLLNYSRYNIDRWIEIEATKDSETDTKKERYEYTTYKTNLELDPAYTKMILTFFHSTPSPLAF